MSKVYEALKHAHTERVQKKLPREEEPTIVRNIPISPPVPDKCDLQFGQEMLILDQSISTLRANHGKNVIQFISSQQGEGTSTIVREFARISSEHGSKSVLLIDADSHQLPQHQNFGMSPKSPLEQVMSNGGNLDQAVSQVGKSKLFLSALFTEAKTSSSNVLLSKAEEVWEKIRQRFDLILIDSVPVSASVEGIALCPMADGVVLVIEAERTRSHVVRITKERITKSGGNLLGLVFNKQRYYIPEWIYKKL